MIRALRGVAQRLGLGDELEGAVIEGHLARCVTFLAFLRRDGEDRDADGFEQEAIRPLSVTALVLRSSA